VKSPYKFSYLVRKIFVFSGFFLYGKKGELRCLGNCLSFDTEFCNPSPSGGGFTGGGSPNQE